MASPALALIHLAPFTIRNVKGQMRKYTPCPHLLKQHKCAYKKLLSQSVWGLANATVKICLG